MCKYCRPCRLFFDGMYSAIVLAVVLLVILYFVIEQIYKCYLFGRYFYKYNFRNLAYFSTRCSNMRFSGILAALYMF